MVEIGLGEIMRGGKDRREDGVCNCGWDLVLC